MNNWKITPLGVYALSDCATPSQSVFAGVATPGVIFCLRHKKSIKTAQTRSPITPYYLVYVREQWRSAL